MMFPAEFPHDMKKKPKLLGEKLVYDALREALDDSWSVFYDRPVKGTRRRVDFLCINPDRCVIAIEVKGGTVHNWRGNFKQVVRRDGTRKVVTPFDQAKQALGEVLACSGTDAISVPKHLLIFFPQMSQKGFTFSEGPHVFTRENLEPASLWAKLDGAMPAVAAENSCAALRRLELALGGRQQDGTAEER